MTNPAEPTLPTSNPSPGAGHTNAAPPQNRPSQSWMLVSIIVIGMIAGASVVMLLSSTPHDITAAAPATRTASAATDFGATAVAMTPKWSGGVRRLNGRNVAVYELEAENDIAIWGKVVRPVLTVRCLAGTTEVFVFTQSAAAIDGQDGKHDVRVAYDGATERSERWIASDEYDALFTDNGVSAARRIATARTMRFGFTPYNASPVVATFQVAGFDALAPKLAQTCRWK